MDLVPVILWLLHASEHKAFRRNFMLRRRKSLCSEARELMQSEKVDQRTWYQ